MFLREDLPFVDGLSGQGDPTIELVLASVEVAKVTLRLGKIGAVQRARRVFADQTCADFNRLREDLLDPIMTSQCAIDPM